MKVYSNYLTGLVLFGLAVIAAFVAGLIYLGFFADLPEDDSLTARKAVLFLLLIISLLTPSRNRTLNRKQQNPYGN